MDRAPLLAIDLLVLIVAIGAVSVLSIGARRDPAGLGSSAVAEITFSSFGRVLHSPSWRWRRQVSPCLSGSSPIANGPDETNQDELGTNCALMRARICQRAARPAPVTAPSHYLKA